MNYDVQQRIDEYLAQEGNDGRAMLPHLAWLVGRNGGSFTVGGWGIISGGGPFGGWGLQQDDAIALIHARGIASGIGLAGGDEAIRYFVNRVFDEMHRVVEEWEREQPASDPSTHDQLIGKEGGQ